MTDDYEEGLEGMAEEKEENKVKPHIAADTDPISVFKMMYSTILLLFSIVIITGLMFDEQTSLSQDVSPFLAFFVFWIAIIWLGMIEGGQASLVGLPPIPREMYKESHPISFHQTSFVHKGDNLDRYLMGRQFMVIFVVFSINVAGAPVGGASVFGWPDIIQTIFLESGVAMTLVTCMVGQLATQVNASHCMLDYINTHFATFTHRVAMAVEFSGLMHTSYLIAMIVANFAGKPIESKEPPRDAGQNLFFWARVLMSLVVLSFCLAVTFVALFEGKTNMWEALPNVVALIVMLVLWCVVGMLEAMQIAFFAAAKLKKSERGDNKIAKSVCKILYRRGGHNLAGFMIGRQLCVVTCFFVAARGTSLNIEVGTGENIFGISDGFQEFLNLGFQGAVITTILASITWQLVASAFPMAFLSSPVTYILLRICLILEGTGICSGAWFLAMIHATLAGYQRDEVYVGTAEERAAKKKALEEGGAEDETPHVEAGHLYPGAQGFTRTTSFVPQDPTEMDVGKDEDEIMA